MNHNEREINVPNVKVACVYHFQKCYYGVIAMLDNEPGKLNSISKASPEGEILLLHANTLFE